jgi:hypothetical protein
MLKIVLAALAAATLGGCASAPRVGAENIVVSSSQDAARGCHLLGQTTVGGNFSESIYTIRESAVTNIRNRAVEMGGNLVVSAGPQVSMPGPIATMNGDVYRCGS